LHELSENKILIPKLMQPKLVAYMGIAEKEKGPSSCYWNELKGVGALVLLLHHHLHA